MFKRPRDIFDSPVSSSPPVKRARTSFTSSSPFAGSSSPAYLCTPYQPPSDSPSNPLGFNRTVAALQLPCETSFSKHLSLRFQLVLSGGGSHDDSPKGKGKAKMTSRERMQDAGEGVYRVVQVPRNYTFRHLHQLIFFLFASDARLSSLSSLSRTRRRSTRLTEMPALRAQAKARQSRFGSKRKADLEDGPDTGASQDVFTAATPGHVFDVLDGVGMYHSAYRPGVVKRGTGSTRVRLSSVRDRSLFPDVFEREQDRVLLQHAGSTAEVEEDVFGPVKGAMSQETMATAEDEEDRREWSWEPEGDFMVGDVWSGEPDPKKAIIYVRTSSHLHLTATDS
ncbi:hypothetical protein OBBRIDRAFT_789766 [Obba rivulosa]|uniref:Uncharacterized protein n=1 Tax=Obba rivulosa TaxID=1052685 RepID=A0A8E2J3D2_9APHY|nr:hypothetical protein OBBRIDRAFT_789766 [Obba rivulosa]